MTRNVYAAMLLSLLMFAIAIPSFASGNNNDVLNLHVSQTVAIPGNVLTPGDYTVRMIDKAAGPRIAEITSKDNSKIYGIFGTIPASRQDADTAEVKVAHEGSEGVSAIKSFYFPGESQGYSFVYSRRDLERAEMLMPPAATRNGM